MRKEKKKKEFVKIRFENSLENPKRINGTPITSNKTGSRFLIDEEHNCLPATICNKQDRKKINSGFYRCSFLYRSPRELTTPDDTGRNCFTDENRRDFRGWIVQESGFSERLQVVSAQFWRTVINAPRSFTDLQILTG